MGFGQMADMGIGGYPPLSGTGGEGRVSLAKILAAIQLCRAAGHRRILTRMNRAQSPVPTRLPCLRPAWDAHAKGPRGGAFAAPPALSGLNEPVRIVLGQLRRDQLRWHQIADCLALMARIFKAESPQQPQQQPAAQCSFFPDQFLFHGHPQMTEYRRAQMRGHKPTAGSKTGRNHRR